MISRKDCILTGGCPARTFHVTTNTILHVSSTVWKEEHCTDERVLRVMLSLSKWQWFKAKNPSKREKSTHRWVKESSFLLGSKSTSCLKTKVNLTEGYPRKLQLHEAVAKIVNIFNVYYEFRASPAEATKRAGSTWRTRRNWGSWICSAWRKEGCRGIWLQFSTT